MLKIPVATGELVDKVTILQIKAKNATNEQSLTNIRRELNYLRNHLNVVGCPQHLFDMLYSINERLWDVEDDIRKKERAKEFDDEFILLARLVYMYNDSRAAVKKEINKRTNSHIVEEKIY